MHTGIHASMRLPPELFWIPALEASHKSSFLTDPLHHRKGSHSTDICMSDPGAVFLSTCVGKGLCSHSHSTNTERQGGWGWREGEVSCGPRSGEKGLNSCEAEGGAGGETLLAFAVGWELAVRPLLPTREFQCA